MLTYIYLDHFAVGIFDGGVVRFDPHILDELSWRRSKNEHDYY